MLTRGRQRVFPTGTRIDEGALIVFPDDAKWITCTAKTHKVVPASSEGPRGGGVGQRGEGPCFAATQ